jgi:hypothetical protein
MTKTRISDDEIRMHMEVAIKGLYTQDITPQAQAINSIAHSNLVIAELLQRFLETGKQP